MSFSPFKSLKSGMGLRVLPQRLHRALASARNRKPGSAPTIKSRRKERKERRREMRAFRSLFRDIMTGEVSCGGGIFGVSLDTDPQKTKLPGLFAKPSSIGPDGFHTLIYLPGGEQDTAYNVSSADYDA